MTVPQIDIDQLRRQYPEEIVRYFDSVVEAKFAIIDPAIEQLQEDISEAQIDISNIEDALEHSVPATESTPWLMSAADKTKLDWIAAWAQVNTVTGVKWNSETQYRTGNINITKANIGLGNVDNTSDADKPVSTATQQALALKQDKLTAWANITIDENNVISSTWWGGWGSYVAGTGIQIQSNTISNTWVLSVNGQTGAVTVSTPTKTSDLTNDSGFITNAVNNLTNYYLKNETYTKAEVESLVANFAGFLVVANLPTQNIKTNIIYLLGPVGSWADRYEEWIYSNSSWVKIWETSIDLTNYFNVSNNDTDDIIEWATNKFVTSSDKTKWNGKQDKLIAGSNITIAADWKTISAENTTYTAGTGIDITNGVISNTQTSAEWGNISWTLADQADLKSALDWKQETINDLASIRTGAWKWATAVQPNDNVSSLTNDAWYITAASLPTVNNGILTIQKNGSTVDTFSANASTNKTVNITVPTKTSDLTNDDWFITSASLPTKTSDLTNDSWFIDSSALSWYQTTDNMVTSLNNADNSHYPTAKAVSDAISASGWGDMLAATYDPDWIAWDAFDYTNMKNKPDMSWYQTKSNLVTNLSNADDTHYPSAKAVSDAIASAWGWDMLASTYDPDNVWGDAFDYTNFKNTPTIPSKTSDLTNDSWFITSSSLPTVNNWTLTIQKNSTTIDTFSANSSADKTININVPTAVSDLTNDSGFITSAVLPTKVSDLTNDTWFITSAALPTKTSDLTNDSWFIDSSALPTVNDGTLTIQKNGTTVKTFKANQATNVTANITVPTAVSDLTNDSWFITSASLPTKTSDLTNDSGFITNAVNDLQYYYLKTETYSKTEVDNLIADFWWFRVVATLPTSGIKTNIMYLLWPIGSWTDKYEEWIYSDSTWVKIWETTVDLTNYVTLNSAQTISWVKTFSAEPVLPTKTADAANNWTKPATEAQVYKKQDKLTAGSNIQINWSTISATDTTYESKTAAAWGTDLSLVTTWEKDTWNNKLWEIIWGTNVTIGADGKTINSIDTKYTAGTGISLSGTVINNTWVTSVNGNNGAVTVAEFAPWAWSTGQVLTKTANWYWYANAPVTSVGGSTWAVSLKTINGNDIVWSWNIAISWGHDYSWNTLTWTSLSITWSHYRNMISTSSDVTVSTGTWLTPWMEYILRITNSDTADHTMTFDSQAYIIPAGWSVNFRFLCLTATTLDFDGPRYVSAMPATPNEGKLYHVI